ncbi:MAG: Glu-tRNA(Gln) amidotransferase subunit GatD [archaeon]
MSGSYPPEIEARFLASGKIAEGNAIEVELSSGAKEQGILMPRISAGNRENLVLKLPTGYNLAISPSEIRSVRKTGEGIKIGKIIPARAEKPAGALPKIGLVSTGGTIGTHVDYSTGGVYMCRTPEEVISTVPEISKIVDIAEVSSPFTIASEDMDFSHFSLIAEEVGRMLSKKEISGVIVTHGTDVLHYTSAALSFALQNLEKPVCVVGAQRSPDRGSFDGSINLLCAANFIAKQASAGVFLVMHGTTNDDYCLAHWGTKARKMHTSRRDAFQSVNKAPFAKIFPDGRIEILGEPRKAGACAELKLRPDFEDRTAIVKIAPNLSPEVIDHYASKGFRGIVIEGTGLGHVITNGPKSWLPSIKNAVDAGIVVAMTSQAIYGAVHPYTYRNLRLLGETGAVFAKDTLPETAYVKLAWLLGQKKSPEEVRALMQENLAGEINERISEKDFLEPQWGNVK